MCVCVGGCVAIKSNIYIYKAKYMYIYVVQIINTENDKIGCIRIWKALNPKLNCFKLNLKADGLHLEQGF